MRDISKRIGEYKKQGYDGLYNPDTCACQFDCPCEMESPEDFEDCEPGYIIKKEQYNEDEAALWNDYEYIIGDRKL